MRIKTCAARIKATGSDAVPAEGAEDQPNESGLKAGQFEAIVSAFGNVDAVGDVVMPGAFVKSLGDWKASGNPIPVIWSHDHGNLDAHVGQVDEAKEIEEGLYVKGTLDLEEPGAAKVFKLLKSRRVTKFSFAYDVKEGVENKSGGLDLKELDLWEVGPTLIPANSSAQLLDIKSVLHNEGIDMKDLVDAIRGIKAGRVLSSKNETALNEALGEITSAVSKIKNVVKSVGTGDDEEKAVKPASSGEQPVKDNAPQAEDPELASSAERLAKDTVLRTRLGIDQMLAEL